MTDKISTIILNVDLEWRNCDKRIKKTLCKLQERENIHTIAFDEKKNTVTMSGPFDPDKICKKLCCKAGKVIIGIEIKRKPDPKPDTKPVSKPDPPPSEQSVVVQVAQLPGTSCGCGCESGYGVVYGAPAYKTCTFFCEEDPQSSCSVM